MKTKLHKKSIFSLLALVLVIGLLPQMAICARAEHSSAYMEDSFLHADPVDTDEIPDLSVNRLSGQAAIAEHTVTSVEEFADILRYYTAARKGNFNVTYLSDVPPMEMDLSALCRQLDELLVAHTGVGSEGDYIYHHNAVHNHSAQYYGVDVQTGLYAWLFEFGDIVAMTTAEQEAQVTAKIAELFEEWQIYDKSDYHKIKLIYDYICSHVTYDHENLRDDQYTLKYTAYAALIQGTAVCLGYANLFYRMANDAGVDARIVTGMASADQHAWNIVRLDGGYYLLDSTWDAGVLPEYYDWFLLGEPDFYDHTPNDDWSTYNISRTNYLRPTATSITIQTLPTCLEYTQGDPLNFSGLALQLTYSDGYTGLVTGICGYSGFDSGTTGKQTVMLHYDGATATYDVEVHAGTVGWVYHDTWGDFTWTLTQDGVLTLSGEGPLKNEVFGYMDVRQWNAFVPWTAYAENITALVIEDGITSIGTKIFYSLYNLKSVTMANSVTKINEQAFSYCESLAQILLPDSVEHIDGYAFYYCTALSDIHIGPNVSFIGENCFYETSFYHNSANWKSNMLYLENNLLDVHTDWTTDTFEIPEGTVLIAQDALRLWYNMVTLKLPVSVKYINAGAFLNASDLQRVYYDGSTADWRKMQIGYHNTYFTVAEFVFAKTEYDFTISTDETLMIGHLNSNGGRFTISDDTLAETTYDYSGNGYILKPLRPGVVLLNVLDAWYNRVAIYTILIQEGAHKMEFVALLNPATCSQPGTEEYVCVYCGHKELVPTELAAHTLVYDPPVKETCETDGLTYGFHCQVCQYVSSPQQVIPATGHDFSGWILVHAPTATGPAEYQQNCRNCDTFETRQEYPEKVVIMAWPDKRTYVEGESFDPTGLEVNVLYSAGFYGVVTDYSITGYDSTPGTKTITITCGGKTATFTVYVTPKEHIMGPWTVIKAALCTEPGSQQRKCANCDHMETRDIPATGHQYTAAITSPTCTVDGFILETCTACSDSKTLIQPATGHRLENGICTVCGHVETVLLSGSITAFGEGTVTLTLTAHGAEKPLQTVTVDTGSYTLNVTPGQYILTVSKENHVTRQYTVTVEAEALTMDVKIHLIGDITGDGNVNIGDVAKLYAHIKGTSVLTDENIADLCDITGDGNVNIGDVAKLYAHIKGTSKLY